MMGRALGLGLWALGLALTSSVASAQEARLHVPADSVFVGERFELQVAVEHSVGSSVTFPEVPDGDPEAGLLLSFGDAEVFSARRLPPRLDGVSRVDSIIYEAATFALDNAVIGPVLVELMAGGDTSIVPSNTATVPVRSVLPANEADLQPPGPHAPFPSSLWVWVFLAASALVAAVLLFWLWRRLRGGRASAKPRLAPYPEATRRLQILAIPEAEPNIKAFYVELSDLLRTYLSRTLGAPALELTTRELTNALASDDRVPEAALKNVRGTLRVADLVKFADIHPDSGAHATAMEKTREAVELIEAAVHPPEDEVAEDGGPKTEDGEQGAEVRSQEAEDGRQLSEDR